MLYSPNHENYTATLLGLMSIGAIPCLANPAYTGTLRFIIALFGFLVQWFYLVDVILLNEINSPAVVSGFKKVYEFLPTAQ